MPVNLLGILVPGWILERLDELYLEMPGLGNDSAMCSTRIKPCSGCVLQLV